MSAPSLPSDQDPAFTYSSIGVPTLHLTGTHDSTPIPGLSTMPEERRIPFDSLAAGPRYLGIFEGGRHSMFSDWGRGEEVERISRLSEQNDAASRDALQAATDLERLASRMAESVARFRVEA